MTTPIKNRTQNHDGLPSKLNFMLTHTYILHPLLIGNMQTTKKKSLLSLKTKKRKVHILKIKYLHAPVEVFRLNPICWCWESHKREQNHIFHFTLKSPTAINI